MLASLFSLNHLLYSQNFNKDLHQPLSAWNGQKYENALATGIVAASRQKPSPQQPEMSKAKSGDLDLEAQKRLLQIKMKLLQAQLQLQSQQQNRGRELKAPSNEGLWTAPFGRTSSNDVHLRRSPIPNPRHTSSTSPIGRAKNPQCR